MVELDLNDLISNFYLTSYVERRNIFWRVNSQPEKQKQPGWEVRQHVSVMEIGFADGIQSVCLVQAVMAKVRAWS